MNRRQFLIHFGSVTLALSLPALTGCGTTSAPATLPADLTVTSTIAGTHTHKITLTGATLASPPAAGFSENTTNDGEHVHPVVLTQAQLTQINAGTAVTKTTEADGTGYTHDFTFQKARALSVRLEDLDLGADVAPHDLLQVLAGFL